MWTRASMLRSRSSTGRRSTTRRSAAAAVQAAQYSFKDAHDLVVLAVGYSYLLAVADEARIETTSAQVDTAQALYNQASDQVNAGTSPAIDGLRARVELQTRQQRLIQARNDFAIQQLALARVIGLAPGQQFELTDKSPYQPFAGLTVEEALERARQSRSDYRAAEAEVRAADYSRRAAEGEYLPSLSLSADYGLASNLSTYASHGVFDVRGTLSIPIFLGGKVHGDVLQADAALAQSRQRLDRFLACADRYGCPHRTAESGIGRRAGGRGAKQCGPRRPNTRSGSGPLCSGCHRYGGGGAGARDGGQRARAIHLQLVLR